MRTFRFRKFDNPVFDSKIKIDAVKNKERWIGYFFGPALFATVNGAVGGSYLNSFYTDVLHLNGIAAGAFLALMPVISKIIDAITNVIMGNIVEHTRSRQGKARPWILISGPLVTIAAILLFLVPESNAAFQVVWVSFTYNLYYSVAMTMYNLSNVIMIPVSTRDSKARDTLATANSMGISMVSGFLLAALFPAFVLPYIGVDRNKWILVMSAISVLSMIGGLLQYYFTRERITEENLEAEIDDDKQGISLLAQAKGCLSSKYWIMIMIVMSVHFLVNSFSVNSMLYYANWVVGSYNDGITLTMLNMIGQFLLGPGVIVMWPAIKKFGKQKVFIICGVIGIAGSLFGVINATNFPMALAALSIRSIGMLPFTYVLLSVMADALDHVEWKCGYRCDGASASLYSIIITVSGGLGLGLLNIGLSLTGYIPPVADGSWVEQSAVVKNFLTFAAFGSTMIALIIITIIFCFFNLEKKLPEIKKDMEERRKKKMEECE